MALVVDLQSLRCTTYTMILFTVCKVGVEKKAAAFSGYI